jgi:hypothetical protein
MARKRRASGTGGTFTSFLPSARRRAITDGVFGGDRRWLVLGGLAWALRAYQHATTKDEVVVYASELKPGETLVLARQAPKPTRRERRKARRS